MNKQYVEEVKTGMRLNWWVYVTLPYNFTYPYQGPKQRLYYLKNRDKKRSRRRFWNCHVMLYLSQLGIQINLGR